MHEIIRIHQFDKFYYLTHYALLIEELNKVLKKYSYIYTKFLKDSIVHYKITL